MGALMPRHLYRRQTHNPMGDSKITVPSVTVTVVVVVAVAASAAR
jgi:hypothetical protein